MKRALITWLLATLSFSVAADNECPYSAAEVEALLGEARALEQYKLVRALNRCGSEEATPADQEILLGAKTILEDAPQKLKDREATRAAARLEREQAEQQLRFLQPKEARMEAIENLLSNHNTRRDNPRITGAPQATQVNTTTLVKQNEIIIYQNERIIELLERMSRANGTDPAAADG